MVKLTEDFIKLTCRFMVLIHPNTTFDKNSTASDAVSGFFRILQRMETHQTLKSAKFSCLCFSADARTRKSNDTRLSDIPR